MAPTHVPPASAAAATEAAASAVVAATVLVTEVERAEVVTVPAVAVEVEFSCT